MAEKLFIADKKTLDEVNKKLDNLSVGTDLSKYTLLNKLLEVDIEKIQYNYNTVFEINGSGYVDMLVLTNKDSAYSATVSAKIIVDDKLIYQGSITGSNQNYACGFFNIYDKSFIEQTLGKIQYGAIWWNELPIKNREESYTLTSIDKIFINLKKSLIFKKNVIIQFQKKGDCKNNPKILLTGGIQK